MKKHFFLVLTFCTVGLLYAQQRPAWITKTPPSDGKVVYFVGISQEDETDEATAQKHAMESAAASISVYLGVRIDSSVKEIASFAGREGDTIDYQVDYKEITSYITKGKLVGLLLKEWYAESSPSGRSFKGWGLFTVPVSEIEKELLWPVISEQYSKLVDLGYSQPMLVDTLWVYTQILAFLDENPQHKKLAYYTEDKTPLYHYVTTQIRTLLNSITVEVSPLVQVGDALALQVSSYNAPKIGAIQCRISINGRKPAEYTLDVRDSVAVLETSALPKGKHTLQYELLLKEAVQGTSISNKSGKANFEVVPLLAYIDFAGEDLTDSEKDTLEKSVTIGLQQNPVPIHTMRLPVAMNARNHYVFKVTMNLLAVGKPAPDYTLYTYEASLALIQNGRNLWQSEKKVITDSARHIIIGAADKFFRENADFFRQAGVYLQER